MNWQALRTKDEASEKALSTIQDTATGREWEPETVRRAGIAAKVAFENSQDDAGSYFAALSVAWEEVGRSFSALPDGWDSLAGVWAQALVAYGSALSREDAESLRTIVTGGLSATVEDAAEITEKTGGVLVWVKAHPVATVGLFFGVLVIYQAAPMVLARLVTR